MDHKEYKLDIDLETGEIFYASKSGASRTVKLNHKSISESPGFLENLSGKDAYFIGTIHATKSTGKLNVATTNRNYRYYTLISMLFASIMMISNILSTKLVSVFGFTVAGAMLVYPASYIFDYLLTDIYGYQNARRTILTTIICLILFDLAIYALIVLPASPYWHFQTYIAETFGRMLRTFVASTIVFAFSFFVTSYIFQKVKIKTEGKGLFKRVFYSLMLSEILETWMFCILAFGGMWPMDKMAQYMLVSFCTKVTYELVVYNILTKPIIQHVKRKEQLDTVDWNTNFNPFSWEVNYDESNNIYTEEGEPVPSAA